MICVSVIMPSLNVEDYVEECLRSVLEQTLHNIEILCVDAGSTDGTVEIIKSYMKIDNRVRLLHSDVKSYGYQLNMGLANAAGEYIAIVETDDIVPEDMLDTLLRTADRSKADFVKAGFISFGSFKNKKYFSSVTRNVPKDIWNCKIDLGRHPEIGLCDINHIWTGLYRKKFLLEKRIRFNETPGASYQDTSFSILAGLLADSCVYIDDIVYMYRIDNAGSSVRSDAKIRCVIDEFDYIEHNLREAGKYTYQIKQLLAHQKIFVYSWNCRRLPRSSAEKFLSLIRDELQEIQFLIENDKLEPYEVENMKILCEKGYLQEYVRFKEKQKNKFYEVVKLLEEEKNVIIIGAGFYAEQILVTGEMLGANVIWGIADNSTQKQGKMLMGYEIKSVEQIVSEYPKGKYLIASKAYSAEIRDQLLRIGMEKGQIIEINAYPGLSGIICNLKEMETNANGNK